MKINYGKIASDIIEIVGIEEITTVTHCATRLRLGVEDKDKIDFDSLKQVNEVKGIFYNSGQLQIILGSGIVNKVYDEILEKFPILRDSEISLEDSKRNDDNKIKRAVRELSDVFIPIIPAIVATGLFLGLKGVVLNDAFLQLFGLSSSMVPAALTAVLTVLTDTVFAFLPAFITWSVFKKMGASEVLGFAVGLMLVSPALPNAYDVANINSGVEPIMVFGFIPLIGYQGSVLTALAVGYVGAKTEKYFRKTMPNSLDLMFTPFMVILIAVMSALFVFGPILHLFEQVVIQLVLILLSLPFGIGGFFIGMLYPLAVMTGMHHLFIVIETSLLASTGFNPVITVNAMYGFANAGICFAVAKKTLSSKEKVISSSAGITQLFGVSEPALFGVVIPRGTRMLLILIIWSGIGGGILSMLSIQANSYGLAVILSPLMYLYDSYQLFTYIAVGIGIFIAAFITTYVWGMKTSENKNDFEEEV